MTFSLFAVATLTCALLMGLLPVLVDGIQKPIEARLGLPVGRAVWFGRLFYLAWLPGMPAAGWFLDAWPNREILFLGLIALILGMAWLALLRDLPSLLLNSLLLGTAYSLITTATVRLMTVAFFPEESVEYRLNLASLNLGFVMVGLGALVGPWLVQAIEHWWGPRQGLLYFSVLLIAPAALVALCEREIFPEPRLNTTPWLELATHPYLMLAVFVILVYFALENLLEYWPEAFLRDIQYQDRGVKFNLIVFGLAFIATRGAAAWWFYFYPDHGIVVTFLFVIGSAFVLGNLAGGFDVGSGTLGFWLAGACYGPILPGLLGMALDFYAPNPLPGSALGVLLALSGLDTLLMRPIMDKFARGRPARSVMRAPTFLAIVLAAPLLLLAFLRN
ncbi:MAG: MFS transporter [Planctomycetes bacterium]|nr:MFS transporter [Planctomycetota bacterium]